MRINVARHGLASGIVSVSCATIRCATAAGSGGGTWAVSRQPRKGRHPAALNFGDCCTYAVASIAGEPLLCTGDDFAQTDLALVSLNTDDAPPGPNRAEQLPWR